MVRYPSRRLRQAVLSLPLSALALTAPAAAAERFVRNAVALAACVDGESQAPEQFLGFMVGLRDGEAVVATVKHGVLDAAGREPFGRLQIQTCFGETVCRLETDLQTCRPDISGDGKERPARATVLSVDKELDLAFLSVPFPRKHGWIEDFVHPSSLRRSFDLGWLLEPGAVWSLSERPDVEISPNHTAPELLSLSPNAAQNTTANQPTYVPPQRTTAVLGGQSGGPVMTARGILGMVLQRSSDKGEALLIDEIRRRAGLLWTGREVDHARDVCEAFLAGIDRAVLRRAAGAATCVRTARVSGIDQSSTSRIMNGLRRHFGRDGYELGNIASLQRSDSLVSFAHAGSGKLALCLIEGDRLRGCAILHRHQ